MSMMCVSSLPLIACTSSCAFAYSSGRLGSTAGQFLPSCFKIGPYSALEHPQQVLTVRSDHGDEDLSWLRAATHAFKDSPQVQQHAHLAEGDIGQPLDDRADVELTASASDGSDVVQRSGSRVSVSWKGVPWSAAPFEYWVWH